MVTASEPAASAAAVAAPRKVDLRMLRSSGGGRSCLRIRYVLRGQNIPCKSMLFLQSGLQLRTA